MGSGVARYARAGMLDVIGHDYVRAARARGLAEWTVLVRHALPNALLPLITVFALYLPVLLSGAVFVETVFAWPGMGTLMVEAVGARDYPLILAGSLLFGALVVVGNLAADVLYAWADPRVRYD
jgi:peptide/nickel transport system permease protein